MTTKTHRMGTAPGDSKFKQGLRNAALGSKIKAGYARTKATVEKYGKPLGANQEKFLSVQCGLCRNLPQGDGDPVMPSGCECLFCRECITPWLKKKPYCPVCKAEAAQVPRVDGNTLSVLRSLTFEMAGTDLSTHLEQGGECDNAHPYLGSNPSEMDNPPLIRPGTAPPSMRPKKRSIPRIVSRHGVPSPSISHMGWGALPVNPSPLTDTNQSFDNGISVASPAGKLVNRVKKAGWANMTAKELETKKKEERMAKRREKLGLSVPDGPLAALQSSGTVWAKCTGDEWERSWVAARKTEDLARLRKSEKSRQELEAKCCTPYRSKRNTCKSPTPRDRTVKRRSGSPTWYSKCPTPSIFVHRPPPPDPKPLTTPAHLASPFSDAPPPGGWNDDALYPGGETPLQRPETAPPELWRSELCDGREGPPRKDLEEVGWTPGGLLSDYDWVTMCSAAKDAPLTESELGRDTATRSSFGSSPTPARVVSSPTIASTTPVHHHTHGLRERCNVKRCVSKKMLFGPTASMMPLPKATIMSRHEGPRSGVKDQTLPAQPQMFKGKKVHSRSTHRHYMVNGVDQKPPSPQASPRADFLSGVSSFEETLERWKNDPGSFYPEDAVQVGGAKDIPGTGNVEDDEGSAADEEEFEG